MTRRGLGLAVLGLGGCAAGGGAGGARGGQAAVPRMAALASHGVLPGEPDLVLRWNAIPAVARELRVIVHFHGFAAPDERLRLLDGRLPGSGLVLPAAPPTLALLPRGRPRPDRPGTFDWPALAAPGGLAAVIREATGAVGPGLPVPTGLLLTAHSGGGSGLLATLQAEAAGGVRVDEVHLFDALSRDPAPLLRWAAARRGSDPPPALVVIAGPGGWAEVAARRLAAGLARESLTGPHWRVLLTAAPHNDIPRLFGPALLADAAAPLPGAVSLNQAAF